VSASHSEFKEHKSSTNGIESITKIDENHYKVAIKTSNGYLIHYIALAKHPTDANKTAIEFGRLDFAYENQAPLTHFHHEESAKQLIANLVETKKLLSAPAIYFGGILDRCRLMIERVDAFHTKDIPDPKKWALELNNLKNSCVGFRKHFSFRKSFDELVDLENQLNHQLCKQYQLLRDMIKNHSAAYQFCAALKADIYAIEDIMHYAKHLMTRSQHYNAWKKKITVSDLSSFHATLENIFFISATARDLMKVSDPAFTLDLDEKSIKTRLSQVTTYDEFCELIYDVRDACRKFLRTIDDAGYKDFEGLADDLNFVLDAMKIQFNNIGSKSSRAVSDKETKDMELRHALIQVKCHLHAFLSASVNSKELSDASMGKRCELKKSLELSLCLLSPLQCGVSDFQALIDLVQQTTSDFDRFVEGVFESKGSAASIAIKDNYFTQGKLFLEDQLQQLMTTANQFGIEVTKREYSKVFLHYA
jgi:hypothetical protein